MKNLVNHGADVNAKAADGTTALDFAIRSGDAAVIEVLRKAGAKEGDASPPRVLKPKPAASARAAIDRSIPLLQRTDVAFLRKSGCVSCHNNNLTAMTAASARKQGFASMTASRTRKSRRLRRTSKAAGSVICKGYPSPAGSIPPAIFCWDWRPKTGLRIPRPMPWRAT